MIGCSIGGSSPITTHPIIAAEFTRPCSGTRYSAAICNPLLGPPHPSPSVHTISEVQPPDVDVQPAMMVVMQVRRRVERPVMEVVKMWIGNEDSVRVMMVMRVQSMSPGAMMETVSTVMTEVAMVPVGTAGLGRRRSEAQSSNQHCNCK